MRGVIRTSDQPWGCPHGRLYLADEDGRPDRERPPGGREQRRRRRRHRRVVRQAVIPREATATRGVTPPPRNGAGGAFVRHDDDCTVVAISSQRSAVRFLRLRSRNQPPWSVARPPPSTATQRNRHTGRGPSHRPGTATAMLFVAHDSASATSARERARKRRQRPSWEMTG